MLRFMKIGCEISARRKGHKALTWCICSKRMLASVLPSEAKEMVWKTSFFKISDTRAAPGHFLSSHLSGNKTYLSYDVSLWFTCGQFPSFWSSIKLWKLKTHGKTKEGTRIIFPSQRGLVGIAIFCAYLFIHFARTEARISACSNLRFRSLPTKPFRLIELKTGSRIMHQTSAKPRGASSGQFDQHAAQNLIFPMSCQRAWLVKIDL